MTTTHDTHLNGEVPDRRQLAIRLSQLVDQLDDVREALQEVDSSNTRADLAPITAAGRLLEQLAGRYAVETLRADAS